MIETIESSPGVSAMDCNHEHQTAMYNLLVSGAEDAWISDSYEFPPTRRTSGTTFLGPFAMFSLVDLIARRSEYR